MSIDLLSEEITEFNVGQSSSNWIVVGRAIVADDNVPYISPGIGSLAAITLPRVSAILGGSLDKYCAPSFYSPYSPVFNQSYKSQPALLEENNNIVPKANYRANTHVEILPSRDSQGSTLTYEVTEVLSPKWLEERMQQEYDDAVFIDRLEGVLLKRKGGLNESPIDSRSLDEIVRKRREAKEARDAELRRIVRDAVKRILPDTRGSISEGIEPNYIAMNHYSKDRNNSQF